MALSRILARSVPRSSILRPTALFSNHRHRSGKTNRAQLIELDLDQAPSSAADLPEAAAEVLSFGIKRLEDAIHRIIVRRAAPDWLPFLPGYSYWVPPRASPVRASDPADSMIEVIGKLASSGVDRDRGSSLDLLSEDEFLASISAKGWPSSAFYIEGSSRIQPVPMEKVEVKIQNNEDQADNPANFKDEEE